jgi:anaerobic selenocysteine-containing dehydrogenase
LSRKPCAGYGNLTLILSLVRRGDPSHCALNLCPADAEALGGAGDRVRLITRRGAVELPAAVDKRLQAGHVWVANCFGTRYPKNGSGELETAGVNLNWLSSTEERDPFTGCPQHKYTLCRIEKCG